MDPALRSRQLEIEADLHHHLREVREFRKALAFAVRELYGALSPGAVAAAVRVPDGSCRVQHTAGKSEDWDEDLLAAYLAGRRPRIPNHLMLAPVKRRRRNWAVLALYDPALQFTGSHRELLFGVAQTLSDIVDRIDERKLRDIRGRIETKLADRDETKDIIYDILHGIRSLTRYDHSSAFFLAEGTDFRMMAEQIAWRKAKSQRIGVTFARTDAVRRFLEAGAVARFTYVEGQWTSGAETVEPFVLLASRQTREHAPPEHGVILAPVHTPARVRGILKVSSSRPDALGEYEVDLVREFLPLASLAIQFSRRAETLQERAMRAEQKHVLADLTRGISHDVNSALGAVMPLVQQIKEDSARGAVDVETLHADMTQIEGSLQTCRRIFGGMLSIARGETRGPGQANLRQALRSALSVIEDALRRRGVTVEVDLPQRLPELRGTQSDLTQLLLNLCTNARDAMPEGGTLTVRAVTRPDHLELAVSDTGVGLSEQEQERVFESFYTTKQEGTGLGLTIVSSIVRSLGGTLSLESLPGEGSTFRVTIPRAQEES